MEDLEAAPGSPSLQDIEEPQGNNDPGDPLSADIEEENSGTGRTPPVADPTADTQNYDDDEAPETPETMRNQETDLADEHGHKSDDDDESELEELDEKEFEDFDPSALNIPDKPVQVDADNVGLLGVHKRKRTEEEERERKKKKKEGRREKPKRRRVKAGGEDGEDGEFEGGVEVEGKRSRKSKVGPDGRPVKVAKRPKTPEDEETLSPEERTAALLQYASTGDTTADFMVPRTPTRP